MLHRSGKERNQSRRQVERIFILTDSNHYFRQRIISRQEAAVPQFGKPSTIVTSYPYRPRRLRIHCYPYQASGVTALGQPNRTTKRHFSQLGRGGFIHLHVMFTFSAGSNTSIGIGSKLVNSSLYNCFSHDLLKNKHPDKIQDRLPRVIGWHDRRFCVSEMRVYEERGL
jgi:hypothetical protein